MYHILGHIGELLSCILAEHASQHVIITNWLHSLNETMTGQILSLAIKKTKKHGNNGYDSKWYYGNSTHVPVLK